MTTSPRARGTDPQTSHDAAASLDERKLSRVQTVILLILWARGALSDPQIREHYEARVADGSAPRQSSSGLRTRRKELVDAGYITDSGRRKKLDSGRSAIMWQWDYTNAPTPVLEEERLEITTELASQDPRIEEIRQRHLDGTLKTDTAEDLP